MNTVRIEITFDPEADAAYILLKDRREKRFAQRTRFCNIELRDAAINVNFDADGHINGIELLGGRQLLPPSLIHRFLVEGADGNTEVPD